MTLSDKIALRLRRWPAERVFGRFDFLDLGPGAAVGMALKRMQDAGAIRRVRRGYYDRPRRHPVLGTLGVSPEEFAAAVSRRTGERLQAHESTAANELRLTEQVPARLIYLTPGRSRAIKAGPVTIELQHQTARKLTTPAAISAMVFSALRNIGKAHITSERVSHLRGLLKPADCRRLLVDLTKAPAWMHPHLRHIAGEEKAG